MNFYFLKMHLFSVCPPSEIIQKNNRLVAGFWYVILKIRRFENKIHLSNPDWYYFQYCFYLVSILPLDIRMHRSKISECKGLNILQRIYYNFSNKFLIILVGNSLNMSVVYKPANVSKNNDSSIIQPYPGWLVNEKSPVGRSAGNERNKYYIYDGIQDKRGNDPEYD